MSVAEIADLRIQRQSLHDVVVDRLRDLIIEGVLVAGARLNERVLCERLGVSRTPLREAFKVLANEGLVELLPNRGAQVAPLTVEHLDEVVEVMAALEMAVGPLAASRLDERRLAELEALHASLHAHHAAHDLRAYFHANQAIHKKLVEATGNRTLVETYMALNQRILRFRYQANLSAERWSQAVAEHDAIMEALRRRDGAALARLLAAHMRAKAAHVRHALLDTAVTAAE